MFRSRVQIRGDSPDKVGPPLWFAPRLRFLFGHWSSTAALPPPTPILRCALVALRFAPSGAVRQRPRQLRSSLIPAPRCAFLAVFYLAPHSRHLAPRWRAPPPTARLRPAAAAKMTSFSTSRGNADPKGPPPTRALSSARRLPRSKPPRKRQ